MRACVCVRACACACVRACVRACVCVCDSTSSAFILVEGIFRSVFSLDEKDYPSSKVKLFQRAKVH